MIIYIKYNLIFSLLFLLCGNINCHIERAIDTPKNGYANDYVDPHSFYYNKHSQTEERLNVPISTRTQNDNGLIPFSISPNHHCNLLFDNCLNSKMKDIPDELFSRRLINILLSLADFEESDGFIIGNINIEVTSAELKKLKNFGSGEATIRDVDPIIANIFKAPEHNIFQDTMTFIRFVIMNTVTYKEITLTVIVILYTTWVILTTRWNMLKLIGILVVVIFAASFIITWLQLLKEADIKLTVKQLKYGASIPSECRPGEMSWWGTFMSMFSSDDRCQKYYEAVMENSFLQVTPAQALSHMFGTFAVQPAGMFGSAIADFAHHCTKHLWSPLRGVLEPILVVLLIILGVLLMIFLAGGSCGLGPFNLFSLRGPSRSTGCGHIKNHGEKKQPVEVLLKLEISHNSQIHQLDINSDQHVSQLAIRPTPNITKTPKDTAEPTEPVINSTNSENSRTDSSKDKDPGTSLKIGKLALSNHDDDYASGDSNLSDTSAEKSKHSKPYKSKIETIEPSLGSGDN